MENQDKAPESKMGQNWKTVALVAAVLMAGAVMGHSILTSNSAEAEGTAAKPACQTCPDKASCTSQDKAPEATAAAFATQTEGSCCAKKTPEAAEGSESGCCAKKEAAGCCDTAQKASGCAGGGCGGGGCSSSTDAQ
jgi:hypothetical protein